MKIATIRTFKMKILTAVSVCILFLLTACSYTKLKHYEKLVSSANSVDVHFDDMRTTLSETQVEIIKEILVVHIEPKLPRKFRPTARIELFEEGAKIGEILAYEQPDNLFVNFVSEDLSFGFQMTYSISRYLAESRGTHYEMKENEMVQSWHEAAKDLNVDIQSPFTFLTNERELTFQLLIKNFGSRNGTLVYSTDRMDSIDVPQKYGYYCSVLNPLSYNNYDRELFIETLNDWGFYGNKEDKPEWYVGHIYD